MVFDNLKVQHKSFGAGTVVSKSGKYITVKFDTMQKIFVYPDIFEKFLTLEDGTVSADILEDLKQEKAEKQKILDKKHEENERARTRGIVIPSLMKRKQASRTPSRKRYEDEGAVAARGKGAFHIIRIIT